MPTDSDVVIGWNFAPVPKAVQPLFQRPTRFLNLATPPKRGYREQVAALGNLPIQAIVRSMAPDINPLRVATLGFSESCQGPRALLTSGDGSRLDAALMFDGIHSQYVPEGKKSANLNPAYLAPYVAFGKLAAKDGRLMLISTSNVDPGTYVSTTETSNWIWHAITGTENMVDEDPPAPGIWNRPEVPPFVSEAGCFSGSNNCWPRTVYETAPSLRYRKSGGVRIFNYYNVDPTGVGDHRYQAGRVMATLLTAYLVDRWNNNEPHTGVCLSA